MTTNRFRRATPGLAFLAFGLLLPVEGVAQAGDAKDRPGTVQNLPFPVESPPAPILNPEQALADFEIADGYRIELVAAEPLIEDPIVATFDERGRLWVVEMRGYMPDIDATDEQQKTGVIAILTDTDGDGRMDERSVFLDGLVLPRAVFPTHDGALVIEPPQVLFCRDTDGDGKADTREVLGDGHRAGLDNPEHCINGPVYGIDNWLYFANWGQRLRRRADGSWQWAPTTGGGQWGISQDDFGRLYFNTNSTYLIAHVAPPHYGRRNPHQRGMATTNQRLDRDQSTWPRRVNPGVNRAYRKGTLRRDGRLARFTATCGPGIYRGDLLADARGDAFVPEPAGNFVRRATVAVDDRGGVTATNAYPKREFWTSSDERFRPVSTANGPDGGLYVVDMYRGVIQHKRFVTSYLRRHVEAQGLETPLGMGRIWRVVPRDATARRAPFRFDDDAASWVAALAHDNGWVRTTAQKLLVERCAADPSRVVGPLRTLARSAGAHWAARVHALWTLHGLEVLDRATLLTALRADAPELRAHAARCAEARLGAGAASDGVLAGVLVGLADDEVDARVRLQLAFSLGAVHPGATAARALADSALAELLTRAGDDARIRDAVVSGLTGREAAFLAHLLDRSDWQADGPGRGRALRALAGCIVRAGHEPDLHAVLDRAAGTAEVADWRRVALLNGVVDALPRRGARKLRVTAMPPALAALAGGEPPKAVAEPVAKIRAALEVRPADEVAERAPLTAAAQALFDRGAALYPQECAACHQPNGNGLDGLAPPLRGSEWVLGSDERLVRIVLNGLTGPIDVAGTRYDLPLMPDHARLPDADIAALLTWIRRAWDHDAPPIDAATVAGIRQATGSRREPWTADELQRVP